MPLIIGIIIALWSSAVDSSIKQRNNPRPNDADCPDCRPAIRSALVACSDVNSRHGY